MPMISISLEVMAFRICPCVNRHFVEQFRDFIDPFLVAMVPFYSREIP